MTSYPSPVGSSRSSSPSASPSRRSSLSESAFSAASGADVLGVELLGVVGSAKPPSSLKGRAVSGAVGEPLSVSLSRVAERGIGVSLVGRVEEEVSVRLRGKIGGAFSPVEDFADDDVEYEVAPVEPSALSSSVEAYPTQLFYSSGTLSRRIPVSQLEHQREMGQIFSRVKEILQEKNPARINIRQRILERQVEEEGVLVTKSYDLVHPDSIRALLIENGRDEIEEQALQDIMAELEQLSKRSEELLQKIDPFEETGNLWHAEGVGDLRAEYPHEVLKRFDRSKEFQRQFIQNGMKKLGLTDQAGSMTREGEQALAEIAGTRAYIRAEKERLEREVSTLRALPKSPKQEAELAALEKELDRLTSLSQVAIDWMIMQAHSPKAEGTLREWLHDAGTTPDERRMAAERSARCLREVVEESRTVGMRMKEGLGWSKGLSKEESFAHAIYFFSQDVMGGEGRPAYLRFCTRHHMSPMRTPDKEREVMEIVVGRRSLSKRDDDHESVMEAVEKSIEEVQGALRRASGQIWDFL